MLCVNLLVHINNEMNVFESVMGMARWVCGMGIYACYVQILGADKVITGMGCHDGDGSTVWGW